MTYYNLSGVPIDVNEALRAAWASSFGLPSCGGNQAAIQQSQAAANEIKEVINQYPHATGELSQRFVASVQAAADANLCVFFPGTGPILEESHAVLELARAIAANPPPPPPLPEVIAPTPEQQVARRLAIASITGRVVPQPIASPSPANIVTQPQISPHQPRPAVTAAPGPSFSPGPSPTFLPPEQSFTEQSFTDDTFIPTKKKLGKLPIVIGLLLLGGIGFWLVIK